MSDEGTSTVTLKMGAGYESPWVVVHGASLSQIADELIAEFAIAADPSWSFDDLVIAAAQQAQGKWAAATGLNARVVGGEAGPATAERPKWGGNRGATGGGGGDRSAAPTGAPAPSCPHGQMTWRESKPGASKDWKGWFCPSPQGTPDQCKPKFQ